MKFISVKRFQFDYSIGAAEFNLASYPVLILMFGAAGLRNMRLRNVDPTLPLSQLVQPA